MKTVQMRTIEGVRDAVKVEERTYREVPGAGIEVARGGRVRVGDQYPEIDDFPCLVLPGIDGLYRAHVPAAVALTWITREGRDEIRAAFPEGLPRDRVGSPDVKSLVERFNVWKWAIYHVANTPETEMKVVDDVPLSSWAGRDVTRVENVEVSDYHARLFEEYRPPSKGGNTTALHVHAFRLDGEKYSFFARGTRKWIHAGDRVSFDYVTTEDGYRNVLPTSVVMNLPHQSRRLEGVSGQAAA